MISTFAFQRDETFTPSATPVSSTWAREVGRSEDRRVRAAELELGRLCPFYGWSSVANRSRPAALHGVLGRVKQSRCGESQQQRGRFELRGLQTSRLSPGKGNLANRKQWAANPQPPQFRASENDCRVFMPKGRRARLQHIAMQVSPRQSVIKGFSFGELRQKPACDESSATSSGGTFLFARIHQHGGCVVPACFLNRKKNPLPATVPELFHSMNAEIITEALILKRKYRQQRDTLRRAGEQMRKTLEECGKVTHLPEGTRIRLTMALKAWELAQ